jgi:hypothetical protein
MKSVEKSLAKVYVHDQLFILIILKATYLKFVKEIKSRFYFIKIVHMIKVIPTF